MSEPLPSDATTTPVPPPRRRRRRLFATITTATFVILLLGAELAVRLTLPHLDSLDVFVRSEGDHHDFADREGVHIFEGDPLLSWRLKPNLDRAIWDFTPVSTNADGIRHPRPLRRKCDGAFRIVALGDSVTFGYRVPVVWPERPEDYQESWKPYPRLMEDWLREANPERDIEVVALAVPGYTSHQGLLWLRREIDALKPDIVTLCFGWNDVTERGGLDDASTMPADDRLGVWMRTVVSKSQVLLRLKNHSRRKRLAPATASTPRVSREAFVENIAAAVRLSRDHGADAIVIGPVFRDLEQLPYAGRRLAAYRTALLVGMIEREIPYLEIHELEESSYPGNKDLFGETIHPNHEGHILMAQRILRSLFDRAMLPELDQPKQLDE